MFAAMLFAPAAFATPPVFTGNSLTVPIPPGDPSAPATVIVNMRQQGLISGSAPIQGSAGQGIVFVDGTPDFNLVVSAINFGDTFGAICLALTNSATTVPAGVITVELSLINQLNQSAGPQTVTLINAAGPVVNPNDPVQTAACDDPNNPPVANAGADRTVDDTNGVAGESVTLAGSGTDPEGDLLTYTWYEGGSLPIATGPTPTITLGDGIHTLRLDVADEGGAITSDSVVITVNAPVTPTANAGPDQVLNDSDAQAGETVTLSGSGTPAGFIASYEWFLGQTSLGTGATLQTRLPDGVSDVTLRVATNAGLTATDTVQITVNALQVPTVNAGPDQNVADTDREAGELVTLTGSATDADGTIVSYEWSLDAEERVLGTGQTLETSLPDGVNIVTLRVTDNAGNVGSDTVQITVAAPPLRTPLAELPNLTPNQRKIAQALDRICDRLDELSEGGLRADQQQLQQRCDGIYFNNSAANQTRALQQLGADDFAAARTQILLFANTQYVSVMDRLIALRGGARGLSLAGLNVTVDGEMVPVAQLQAMAEDLLGGGASADEQGGLLSDKLGLWLRGSYSFGEKDANSLSPSFDADQAVIIGGVDYRFSDKLVAGAALAYGDSKIEFGPGDEGALDTGSWALSLYGSMYAAQSFYLDGIVKFATSSYDADRNITYVDGMGLVDFDASGDTDGTTLGAGLSGGYDFLIGGLTVSPNFGFFYLKTKIDGFTEKGAGGLNLIYDEQEFESLTGNIGLRLTYAWNLPWGVLLPHLRADYVRQFEDDVEVFGVRFASDPDAASAPPILVETSNPDTSFWRLFGGFSAQFKHGLSGYVEYQRLESFNFISFEDISFGLRLQRSF